MFENFVSGVQGFVKIKDKETGEILSKSNAIHYGNITIAIANALAWQDSGHIGYMTFGNGGTTIDASGKIVYKKPNTSEVGDVNATLYNTTYAVTLNSSSLSVVAGSQSYADIAISVTLGRSEPSGQDLLDAGDGTGDFVFDELALWASPSDNIDGVTSLDGTARMITHVIFHPVQKSANRVIEIEYTLRIQMGSVE